MARKELYCLKRTRYIEWRIDDFSSLIDVRYRSTISPSFQFVHTWWHLKLYPHAERGNTGWVSVHLCRESTSSEHCFISGQFGIKRYDNGKVYVSRSFRMDFVHPDRVLVMDEFVERSSLLRDIEVVAPRNRATFFLSIVHERKNHSEEDTQTSQTVGVYKLIQDFKDMFLNGKDCDTTIKVSNQEFITHKVVLEARSPVLARMCSHEATELSTRIIEIEDCDPDAFSDYLRFLYSAKLDICNSKKAHSLYAVAQKFQDQEVRQKCVKFMENNLSIANFCDVLFLSSKYNEVTLKNAVADFYLKKSNEITATPQWFSFNQRYPMATKELRMTAWKLAGE